MKLQVFASMMIALFAVAEATRLQYIGQVGLQNLMSNCRPYKQGSDVPANSVLMGSQICDKAGGGTPSGGIVKHDDKSETTTTVTTGSGSIYMRASMGLTFAILAFISFAYWVDMKSDE